MMSTDSRGWLRTAAMAIGLFEVLNGAMMSLASATWFRLTPGVSASGPYNTHFIVDVGLAYVVSGTGLIVAARVSNRAMGLLASAWPLAHAFFHLALWSQHGPPTGLTLWTELAGVVGLSLAGSAAAWGLRDATIPEGS